MKKNSYLILFILTIIIAFIAFNISSSLLLGGAKFDLSKNKIYSLSEKTQNLLKNLNVDVNFNIYISNDLEKELPKEKEYLQYITKLLEEYKLNSPRDINISIKTITPYSATEEEAVTAGLSPLKDTQRKQNLYFGMVISDNLGNFYTIKNLNSLRKRFLENDITRILSKMIGYDKKTIGIMSSNPNVMASDHHFDTKEDKVFILQLRNEYNVEFVSSKVPEIPYNIDALLLINPKNNDIGLSYAVEQYVLRGGKLLAFIDMFNQKNNPYKDTAFDMLLSNWGVEIQTDKIIGDASLSMPAMLKKQNGDFQLVSYPLWMNLLGSNINNIVIKNAANIIAPNADVLLKTSNQGGYLPTEDIKMDNILSNYKQSNKEYNIAIHDKDVFLSVFIENVYTNTSLKEKMLPHLYRSTDKSEFIIVSDSDILNEINISNNNLELIFSYLDYLLGNENVVNVGGKISTLNNTIIKDVLYQKSFKIDELEYNLIKDDLKSTQTEYKALVNKVDTRKVVASIKTLKDLENLQKNSYILLKELNHLDYIIDVRYKKYKDSLIFLNLVVYPFGFILIIFLTNLCFAFYKRKNAKRIVNE